MPQAKRHSTTTKQHRRNGSDQTADPIHAAILAHEKAYHEFCALVDEREFLENTVGDEGGPRTKPVWRDYYKRYDASHDAEVRTAWALTIAIPVTWDGLDALMRHASEYVLQRGMLPPSTTNGLPPAVTKMHCELKRYGYQTPEPWWMALVLTIQKALKQLPTRGAEVPAITAEDVRRAA